MQLTNTKLLSKLSSLPVDTGVVTESPNPTNNFFNHSTGLLIMFLNKIRHEIKGYTSARGFKFEDMERVINYDFRVIKRWMDYLEQYQVGASAFIGKNILELGPGADLGIGLISLAEGAASYNALDVHNLVKGTPNEFYDQLFNILKIDPNLSVDIDFLREQLKLTQKGKNDRLNYLCQEDFDLSVFKDKKMDVILSNSAFQQFDNPAKTIEQLSQISQPGAFFVALLDLKTHTRWINQRDPLNIYRYSDRIYNRLKFRGSQNRFRPVEFKQMLENNGWKNVQIIPRLQLEQDYLNTVSQSLHPKFHPTDNQMDILTCMICATKS